MKKVFKFFSAVALLTLFVGLTSCGDLISNGYVGNSTDREFTVMIDDYHAAARTVLPTEFNASSNLYYKITGQSNNGGSMNATMTFISGTAMLTLDNYNWELTLTAYKDAAFTQPVLRGETVVDMRYTAGSNIRFYLYPLNSSQTEVKGTVALRGTSTGSEVANTTGYTVELYDLTTGNVIEGTKTEYTYKAEDTKGSFTYTKDVAPGEYYAKAVIYNETKALGSWSDLVIVDPGTSSTKSDIVIALAEKPATPTGFKAVYVADSDTAAFKYNVKLVWDRTPHADDYIVTLQEKDAEGENVGEPIILDSSNIYNENRNYRKEGSLLNVDKGLTLSLSHGHIYEATIKARNVVDESATAGTCTYYMDEKTLPDLADLETTHGTATENGMISRFAITYDLNGGAWYTEKNVGNKATKYVFHKFSSSDVDLLKPETFVGFDSEDPVQEYPVLVRASDNSKFLEWHVMTGSSEDATGVTKVSGNKNVTVKALYESSQVQVNIVFANRTDISTSRMTVTYGATNTSLGSTLSIDSNVDIKVSFDGTKSTFEDNSEFDFYDVYFINSRTGDYIEQIKNVTQGTSVVFNTEKMREDYLSIVLAAHKRNSEEYYSITKDVVLTRTK